MTGTWCRRERYTMAAPHTTEAASRPRNDAEPQPHSGALTSASATSPTAAARSPAPRMSGRPETFGSLLSGTTRAARNTAATPTGTLIQKTQRQSICTRAPPITGPNAAPRAPRADQVPRALGRTGGGTAASSSDSDAGTIAPAPAAWITRAAIRAATPGAPPHSAGRQPAKPGAEAKRDHPPREEPPPPDAIGPPARGHQHRGEHDRVGVEHPGQRAQAGARVIPADVGERQVDDEQVQAGHEYGQRQDAHHGGDPAVLHQPSKGVGLISGLTITHHPLVRPEIQLTRYSPYMASTEPRTCSIARTLDIVGEKWALLAIREVFLGGPRFGEMVRRTGAPRDTLAARLRPPVGAGIL